MSTYRPGASGELGDVLVDAAIQRIETLDGPINAVVMRWFERARSEAKGFDELPTDTDARHAPFAGVPFLLKDLRAQVAGLPVTSGNRAAMRGQPLSLFTIGREWR